MVEKRQERKEEKRTRRLIPPVDIYDTEEAVVILADLPGVRPEELDVQVERGTLTIRGRQEELVGSGEVVLQEFEPGEFCRSFSLSEEIDSSRISAEFENGVLKLTLPKMASQQARRITIKQG